MILKPFTNSGIILDSKGNRREGIEEMFDNLRNRLDFDDILFENRNREYGAYQLRKRYNGVVFGSLILAVILFSSTILIPFLIKPRNEKAISAGYGYVPFQMEKIELPEEIYVPPASPPPAPPRLQEAVKYTAPVIVDTVVPVTESLPTIDEAASITDEDLDFAGPGTGEDMVGAGDGLFTDEPFAIVETMPSFRGGGIDKFREWVLQRTNYPQEAVDKKIRGRVLLTFIVETDGSVSNVTVVQGVDPLIDNEAVKTIQASPKWTPGFQRGRPVRVRYVIPLNFAF